MLIYLLTIPSVSWQHFHNSMFQEFSCYRIIRMNCFGLDFSSSLILAAARLLFTRYLFFILSPWPITYYICSLSIWFFPHSYSPEFSFVPTQLCVSSCHPPIHTLPSLLFHVRGGWFCLSDGATHLMELCILLWFELCSHGHSILASFSARLDLHHIWLLFL